MKIDTIALHAGYQPGNGQPHVLPIYQCTTYDYDSSEHIGKLFDLRPAKIVERFGLRNPIFEATASYGHFGGRPYTEEVTVWENGRETTKAVEFFSWEKLDAVDKIRAEFGLK